MPACHVISIMKREIHHKLSKVQNEKGERNESAETAVEYHHRNRIDSHRMLPADQTALTLQNRQTTPSGSISQFRNWISSSKQKSRVAAIMAKITLGSQCLDNLDPADEILVRVSEIRYLEALRKGQVFMRPVKYYRRLEAHSKNERDPKEGIAASDVDLTWQASGQTITFPKVSVAFGNSKPISCFMNLPFREFAREDDWSLDPRIWRDFCKDPDNKQYGILFFSRIEFEQQLEEIQRTKGYHFRKGNIFYTDELNNAKILEEQNRWQSIFRKRKQFDYQHEYRILIENSELEIDSYKGTFTFSVSPFDKRSILIPYCPYSILSVFAKK